MSEPFCETRVCRNEVCFWVGGSAPVVHWAGWSSWDLSAMMRAMEEKGRERELGDRIKGWQ